MACETRRKKRQQKNKTQKQDKINKENNQVGDPLASNKSVDSREHKKTNVDSIEQKFTKKMQERPINVYVKPNDLQNVTLYDNTSKKFILAKIEIIEPINTGNYNHTYLNTIVEKIKNNNCYFLELLLTPRKVSDKYYFYTYDLCLHEIESEKTFCMVPALNISYDSENNQFTVYIGLENIISELNNLCPIEAAEIRENIFAETLASISCK